MNIYYDNYAHLPSKTLTSMLQWEGNTYNNPDRWQAIRKLLSEQRTTRFHIGKTFIVKDL